MRHSAALCAVVVLTCAGLAQAEMALVEDFESYEVDSSIHMQGQDPVGGGSRWYTQANMSELMDCNRAFVVAEGNNKVLRATTQDQTTEVTDYLAIAMSMSDHAIYGQGTIYFRFKHLGGGSDNALMTNDLWPGWDYGGYETGTIDAPSFQGNLSSHGWSKSGVIAFFTGWVNGEGWFRGRDGSASNPPAAGAAGYKDVQVNTHANEWTEFWVQIDHANDRSKFYICPDGGTATVIMNPDGGEWWAMRNEQRDNNAVLNLRFQLGSDGDQVRTLYLDDIAIDDEAMTLERPDVQHDKPGDLDGDGDVDLDDFVILKNNFGTGTGGDCDGDGDNDTDLDDFVILKNNFGK
ncbi:MAG: hypothetical protein GX591_15935 [Planctomycetes bacterium]|nr:hypothetical protein [Planctomycetota bacterium]